MGEIINNWSTAFIGTHFQSTFGFACYHVPFEVFSNTKGVFITKSIFTLILLCLSLPRMKIAMGNYAICCRCCYITLFVLCDDFVHLLKNMQYYRLLKRLLICNKLTLAKIHVHFVLYIYLYTSSRAFHLVHFHNFWFIIGSEFRRSSWSNATQRKIK